MAAPPLTPPPQGDESRAGALLTVCIVFSSLSTIVVILRLYTRIIIVQQPGWDDYTMVMAQIFGFVNIAGELIMYASGTGHHMYYVSIDNFVRANMWFHLNEFFYFLATVLIKISACLFLLRIIGRATGKTLRRFLYALMIMMVVLGFVASIVFFVTCVPLAGAWDPRIKAKCFSTRIIFDMGYFHVAWPCFTDLACASFPVIVMRRMQMKLSKKIGLWIIMGLGVFTAVACICRVVHFSDLARGDFTWDATLIVIWAIVERNIGVIATSMPALQPLIKQIFDHLKRDSTKNGGVRTTPALNMWKGSTANAFGPGNRNFQPIEADPSTASAECILPSDCKTIRKTTDVDLSFTEVGDQQSAKDTAIEMKSKDEQFP